MVAAKIDLIAENSVEVGADFSRQIAVCNMPDLTLYTGLCQIRNSRLEVITTAKISIQSPTLFTISLSATETLSFIDVTGDIVFDVLFAKNNHRFFAIRGKLNYIQTITRQII